MVIFHPIGNGKKKKLRKLKWIFITSQGVEARVSFLLRGWIGGEIGGLKRFPIVDQSVSAGCEMVVAIKDRLSELDKKLKESCLNLNT